MSRQRKSFDWRKIHAELDRRLAKLTATYGDDQARVQSLLRERSTRLALAPADRRAAGSRTQLLVFRTGGERYGLALESAHEICRMSRIALLPGSSPVIGIINWRGEFVTVFDTARLLGADPGTDDAHAYAIVLRGAEPCVALAAGTLDGVIRIDLPQLQAPDRLGLKQHDLFRGMTGDAVLVLEHERLRVRLKQELHAA